MISFDIKGAKALFFDKAVVMKAMDKATRKALSKFGANVRKRAQTSLVYGEKPSPPGRPPTIHKSGMRKRVSKSTGKVRIRAVSPLREFIFFAYDPEAKQVVIGPAVFNAAADRTAPHTLEYGGTAHAKKRQILVAKADRSKFANAKFVSGGKVLVTIGGTSRHSARPFMHPARDAELPGLPGLWKNSLR